MNGTSEVLIATAESTYVEHELKEGNALDRQFTLQNAPTHSAFELGVLDGRQACQNVLVSKLLVNLTDQMHRDILLRKGAAHQKGLSLVAI